MSKCYAIAVMGNKNYGTFWYNRPLGHALYSVLGAKIMVPFWYSRPLGHALYSVLGSKNYGTIWYNMHSYFKRLVI